MKRKYWIAVALGLSLVLMSTIIVLAINETVLDWWVLAGGGAPSSGDSITMNSTLGQPVIGISSGENVSLRAGYWVDGAEYLVYMPVVMR
ncbi:hypothetical protein ACFLUA_04135 [Chloroflexota bacterium]